MPYLIFNPNGENFLGVVDEDELYIQQLLQMIIRKDCEINDIKSDWIEYKVVNMYEEVEIDDKYVIIKIQMVL